MCWRRRFCLPNRNIGKTDNNIRYTQFLFLLVCICFHFALPLGSVCCPIQKYHCMIKVFKRSGTPHGFVQCCGFAVFIVWKMYRQTFDSVSLSQYPDRRSPIRTQPLKRWMRLKSKQDLGCRMRDAGSGILWTRSKNGIVGSQIGVLFCRRDARYYEFLGRGTGRKYHGGKRDVFSSERDATCNEF